MSDVVILFATGQLCDTVITSCDPNPCKAQGTCQTDSYGVFCECPAGYFGLFCQFAQSKHLCRE